VGAVLGGATGAILGAQSEQRPQPYYVWGQDGRCYLQNPNGAVTRVSRSNCQ
jgi:hypothetical protein